MPVVGARVLSNYEPHSNHWVLGLSGKASFEKTLHACGGNYEGLRHLKEGHVAPPYPLHASKALLARMESECLQTCCLPLGMQALTAPEALHLSTPDPHSGYRRRISTQLLQLFTTLQAQHGPANSSNSSSVSTSSGSSTTSCAKRSLTRAPKALKRLEHAVLQQPSPFRLLGEADTS